MLNQFIKIKNIIHSFFNRQDKSLTSKNADELKITHAEGHFFPKGDFILPPASISPAAFTYQFKYELRNDIEKCCKHIDILMYLPRYPEFKPYVMKSILVAETKDNDIQKQLNDANNLCKSLNLAVVNILDSKKIPHLYLSQDNEIIIEGM